MKTTVDYQKWIEDACDAGDTETMMIAMRANGETVEPDSNYNLPMARQKQIARMTVAGARRLAAKW